MAVLATPVAEEQQDIPEVVQLASLEVPAVDLWAAQATQAAEACLVLLAVQARVIPAAEHRALLVVWDSQAVEAVPDLVIPEVKEILGLLAAQAPMWLVIPAAGAAAELVTQAVKVLLDSLAAVWEWVVTPAVGVQLDIPAVLAQAG